ncbi:transposase [Limosilactobacillus reuteri]|uniref:Uncharacterized protein n=1 Tax=Limosilactobacillus reuteri MM4-1A TaxID=548485 RepID=A0A828RL68_LIMRT|nr:hypothetical protein HMPREF0535_1826 [Limosilactobacillus reuteri MM2-3]EGC15221.1 hypothetical protein HMPREF0536_10870 [Limosilactobacillus reuteri MM4-1A]OAV47548.1 transposase [Limosilactobacillus reuteri]OFB56393.1 transposase [Limosilactobacillus reuteri]
MVIVLKLFKLFNTLKKEHDLLKKQVHNNQSIIENRQSKFHNDFLQKKKDFENKN